MGGGIETRKNGWGHANEVCPFSFLYLERQNCSPNCSYTYNVFFEKNWWVILITVVVAIIFKSHENINKKATRKVKVIEHKFMPNEATQIHVKEEEIMRKSTGSTESGFVNKNDQKNNGKTSKPGTDFGQWYYEMECLK